MKTEWLNVKEALNQGKALPWALVRSLSSFTLGPAPEMVNLDGLIEARFFSAVEEVRLFRDEAGLRAVCLTSEEGDAAIEREHKLANPKFGRTITVRQVLAFDEDGQAFIAYTLLIGWEGGT